MLESRCVGCHNDDKREGELVMTSYESLRLGGENGAVVVGGRPEFSDLYSRITLPSSDSAFMPAEGKPALTDAQVEIIEWWITAGLPNETTMAQVELQPDADTEALIRAELGLE
jgi:mono/diheme cytochrome c family protein